MNSLLSGFRELVRGEKLMAYDDPRALGTSLSLEEAVPLVTAFAGQLAARHGVRMLVLKGPQAAADGLRGPRSSYDADLLVDPSQLDLFVEALGRAGWTTRPAPGFPMLLPPHSVSLSHPGWSVDIDLHWNWPGFLMLEADAFEILWNRRRRVQLAGAPIDVPSRADAALILALHVLRESRNLTQVRRRAAEYQFLVEAVNADPSTRALVRDYARELNAEQTANPFLRALGFTDFEQPSADAEYDQHLQAWLLHQASDHAVAGWVHELSRAPLWRKPLVAVHAVFPSPQALRAADPFIGAGPWQLARGWWRRTRRGLRTAASARKALQRTTELHAS
ncbi:hypothetical protein JOF28_001467 [Leucobacter exalbidus]|uniref:Nucleotidyltransferase family protein n=1 Tax=Leucobacter exalbidus TaxID=662960 RepID=A0A940T0V2_9MICO|nr:nucleotidyltransferase family protein [Leucobacter exalbidus]MBP1326235.1 hypothetical protein [Leucobacter exalbidus]